jgi:hypothetical protein
MELVTSSFIIDHREWRCLCPETHLDQLFLVLYPQYSLHRSEDTEYQVMGILGEIYLGKVSGLVEFFMDYCHGFNPF